jgi:hypothetical protein
MPGYMAGKFRDIRYLEARKALRASSRNTIFRRLLFHLNRMGKKKGER